VNTFSSDPYCIIQVDDGDCLKTKIAASALEPHWNGCAAFELTGSNSILQLTVFDHDFGVQDNIVGALELPVGDLGSNVVRNGWLKLYPMKGQGFSVDERCGGIYIELKIMERKHWQHFLSYIDLLLQPHQDIDHFYQSIMHICNLAYTHCLSPFILLFFSFLFWIHPVKSAAAVLIWNLAPKVPKSSVVAVFLSLCVIYAKSVTPTTLVLVCVLTPRAVAGLLSCLLGGSHHQISSRLPAFV